MAISIDYISEQIGGATGRIGDPSGRNNEREEQKEEVVKENVDYISNIILKVFENHKKYFWHENTTLIPVRWVILKHRRLSHTVMYIIILFFSINHL